MTPLSIRAQLIGVATFAIPFLHFGVLSAQAPQGYRPDSAPGLARFVDPNRLQVREQVAVAVQVLEQRVSQASWQALEDSTIGTPTWVSVAVDASDPPAALAGATPDAAARAFLALTAGLWPMHSSGTFSESDREQDGSGQWHFRFRQRVFDLPVRGGELLVHLKRVRSGAWVPYAANGKVFPIQEVRGAGAVQDLLAEVVVVERLSEWGAQVARALDTWVVAANGAYHVARVVAFGTPAEMPGPDRGVGRYALVTETGEILGVFTGAQTLLRAVKDDPSLAAERSWTPPTDSSAASMLGEGVDVFGNQFSFGSVFNSGSGQYELIDRTHEGAEVWVYDNNGFATGVRSQGTLSRDPNNVWNTDDQRQDVSGVVNGTRAVDYFWFSFGRRGMDNAHLLNPAQVPVLVDAGPGINAGYYLCCQTIEFLSGGTFNLNGEPNTALPIVGAEDVVIHEFTHGVTHVENASQASDDISSGIREALSDYFAVIKTEHTCIGDTVITSPERAPQGDVGDADPPGCFRDIGVDLDTRASYWDTLPVHTQGVSLSGALWDARKLIHNKSDFDAAVYNVVTFFLAESATYEQVREATVQTLKTMEHNNTIPHATRVSRYTEEEFYQNGIGRPPVFVTLDYNSDGQAWMATVDGPPNVTFNARMEAGDGINSDESVTNVTDTGDNDPSFTIASTGTVTFAPGQEGWLMHSPSDGHDHAVRVRMPAQTSITNELRYWDAMAAAGEEEPPPLEPIVADIPKGFALEQRIPGQGPAPSFHAGGAAGASRNAADAIRRSGIMGLRVGVPVSLSGSSPRVRVTLFDLGGRVVRRAIDDRLSPGVHDWEWDGLDDAGRPVSPGAYIAIMTAGDFRARRVLIVR